MKNLPKEWKKLQEFNCWGNFSPKIPDAETFVKMHEFNDIQSDKLYVGDDELGKPNIYGETRTNPTRYWEIIFSDKTKYACTALTITDVKNKLTKLNINKSICAIREITQLAYEVLREEENGFKPKEFLQENGINFED